MKNHLLILFIFFLSINWVKAQSTAIECDTVETKTNFVKWLKNNLGANSDFGDLLDDPPKDIPPDELTATYIYYLSKFIQWNSHLDKTYFTIGVFGNTNVDEELTKLLKSKGEQNQKWIIIHYQEPDELNNISCLMLYVAEKSEDKVNDVLEITKDKQIVTIGDNIPNFCEKGGLININDSYEEKKFDVNLSEAKRKGINIQTQILMSSRIVK